MEATRCRDARALAQRGDARVEKMAAGHVGVLNGVCGTIASKRRRRGHGRRRGWRRRARRRRRGRGQVWRRRRAWRFLRRIDDGLGALEDPVVLPCVHISALIVAAALLTARGPVAHAVVVGHFAQVCCKANLRALAKHFVTRLQGEVVGVLDLVVGALVLIRAPRHDYQMGHDQERRGGAPPRGRRAPHRTFRHEIGGQAA
mmetsp:Transcript_1971/g.5502  ORF Transcript_1971/g.5502 Transcript_1971/m.5502 type:complete len:202 (+) Transcript_1971:727-1332(+)